MNTLKENIIYYLQECRWNLTSKQKKLKRFLVENATEIGYMSLRELSEKAAISEVSILNFCSQVGFENFIAMREAFRDYNRNRINALFLETSSKKFSSEKQSELYQYCSEIIENHNEMIQSIDFLSLDRCAKALMNSRDIFILGHDMSKIAADYLASRLNYLHFRSQSINPADSDTVKMLLSNLNSEDTVVIFSFPPYYVPAGDIAYYVRHCGATLITIVGSSEAPVVIEDSINFLCKAQNPYFFNSMSVPLHLIEILVYYIAITAGRKKDDPISIVNGKGDYFTL